MPSDILNARAGLRLWCLLALFLCCAALLTLPHSTEAALARTNLGAFQSAGNPYGTGSFETGSFTPADNSLLVVIVTAQEQFGTSITQDSFTISGGSLTYTKRHGGNFNGAWDAAAAVYTAPVTAGASMTLTVDAGALDIQNYQVQVFNYTGADTSSPTGATANNSVASNSGVLTMNLTSAPALTSEVLAMSHMDVALDTPTGAGTGWSEHYDEFNDFIQMQTQTRTNSSSQTVRWEDITTGDGGFQIAVEIMVARPIVLVKPPNNLGLVGYWSFNEGTSTKATDFSGNGNHGTLSGSTWTSGKLGKALDFNGSSSYVDAGAGSSLSQAGAVTVCAWFKDDSLASARSIISNADNSSANLQYHLQVLTTGEVNFEWSADGASFETVFTDTGVATTGNWYHTCGVRSAGGVGLIYINGADRTLGTSGAVTPPVSPGGNTTIGKLRPNGIQFWDGAIDEIRIYSRALSATEIAKLYQSGAVKVNASSAALHAGSTLASGLRGYWTLDGADMITSSVVDRSGQNNVGYFTDIATSSAPKTIGKLGQGLRFNGNYTVRMKNDDTFGTAQTMAFWMKDEGTDNGDVIMSYSPFRMCFRTSVGTERELACTFNTEDWVISDTEIFDGRGIWHHVVFVMTATSQWLYVDGVLNDTNSPLDGDTTTGPVWLGDREFGGPPGFVGVLDDVRVYNRALSAAEVLQLYNLGTTKIVQ